MKPDHTIDQAYVKLSNRRPARAQRVAKQPDYPPHDHEFYEICVVQTGRALHRTTEGDAWLERGHVVVVAPGQLHSFARASGFGVVNVYYLAEWFLAGAGIAGGAARLVPWFFQRALLPSRETGGVAQFRLGEPDVAACLRDLEEMEAEGERAEPDVLFLEAAFMKCLVRMERAAAEGRVGHGASFPKEILRALAAIDQAVLTGAVLDVKAVAKTAGMSLSHFCRVFRGATGMTAGDYFQRRRVHRACRRLLTTDESATEVAHALGYADSAHFVRRFKQATSMTPLAYRRRFAEG